LQICNFQIWTTIFATCSQNKLVQLPDMVVANGATSLYGGCNWCNFLIWWLQMVQLPDIEVATGATSQYRSSIEISGRPLILGPLRLQKQSKHQSQAESIIIQPGKTIG
jgi:hypothetical protein